MYLPVVFVVAGVFSHVGFFNRGEHHLCGIRYLQLFLGLSILSVTVLVTVTGESLSLASIKVAVLAVSYLTGLYASLLLYRIVLHPLRRFPGPFGARVSTLWFSTQLRKLDAHRQMLRLHQKYGEFVRIGSSDLSIIHPKGVEAIHGPGSQCTKSAFYDATYPMVSMHTDRHRASHDRRRRLWSSAFSDKALHGYETRVEPYLQQLVKKMFDSVDRPINVAQLFNLYSYDIMGDLAFGKSFNMLRDGEEHWAIELLKKFMDFFGYLIPTWFSRLLVAAPVLSNDFNRFIKYCCQKLDQRRKENVDTPDIMASLLAPWTDKEPQGIDLAELQGDANLIIIAGSDTTAATLTCLFYELARNPGHISRLREELAPYIPPSGEIKHQRIQKLEHLNGIINETLRLHPTVSTAMPRTTPPQGLEIGGVHVPGNMTVWCPQYVIGRSEKVYSDPLAFIPERWYSEPSLVKDRSAFAPFSTGAYGCIGKGLALQSVRVTVARVIMSFDVSFASGEDWKFFNERTKDHFTLGVPDLNMIFTKR